MAVPLRLAAVPVVLCLLMTAGLAASGCSSFGDRDPPLPDSTFSRVLVDFHLTTARADRFTRPPPGVTDSVFAAHDIRKEAFDETLRYYARHPDAFSSLYDAVIDTLNALQSRRWMRSPATQALPDSIRRERRIQEPSSTSQ